MRWLFAAFVAVLMVGGPGVASAQTTNTLRSIEPADGASLDTAPAAIVLTFSERLADDDVTAIQLVCNSQPQTLADPEVAGGTVVTASVTSAIPKGTCAVTWSIRSADGDVLLSGNSNFAVLNDPVVTSPTATGTTSPLITIPAVPTQTATADDDAAGRAGGAVWLGRVLSTIGLLVIFGALALISIGWPEGPEYLITVRFLRAVWVLALLGALLYVIAFTADVGDTSIGGALNPVTWFSLFDAGWSGRGALLRLLIVVLAWSVVRRPEAIVDPDSAMWAWGIPLLGLVSVAMSRVAGPFALLGLAINLVHIAAVAIWFGGAALVARVVLAGPGEDDLVQATRTFSRASVPAMLIAVVTGVFEMIRLDGADLFGSTHGRVVLLKVVVVALMIFIGLAARQQVTLRLDRARSIEMTTADRFRRSFGAEAVLGVVVLLISGWMVGLTPPKVDPLAGETYLKPIELTDLRSGLRAKISIGPGQAGPTGLKVEVLAPEQGLNQLVLRFLPPAHTDAFGVEQRIDLDGVGTAYLDDSHGLPLTVPGRWTLQVSAVTTTGVLDGAMVTFELTDATGAIVTAPPVVTTVPVNITVVDQATTVPPIATSP